jgi:hypothetical protein
VLCQDLIESGILKNNEVMTVNPVVARINEKKAFQKNELTIFMSTKETYVANNLNIFLSKKKITNIIFILFYFKIASM